MLGPAEAFRPDPLHVAQESIRNTHQKAQDAMLVLVTRPNTKSKSNPEKAQTDPRRVILQDNQPALLKMSRGRTTKAGCF